jgi:glycosyltransferase involved in cell wall biosynthesis
MKGETARPSTMHVLYSFPDVVGKPGIGVAALHNVLVLAEEGIDVTLVCASVSPDARIEGARDVVSTLEVGGRRIPHRALGIKRSYRYHDRRAAGLLARIAVQVDIVHTWPRAVRRTAAVAHRHGIPVVREVSNTHTAHAYAVAAEEHAHLGIPVPKGHSHAYDPAILALEEAEYAAADLLLVPSPYSEQTFLDRGFSPDRLAPHAYGFDPGEFFPDRERPDRDGPLTFLFAARCEPRKGLHYLLRAWHDSGLAAGGAKLVVLGEFIAGYREALASLLDDPSIECRGFVTDLAGAMRESEVFVLPSVEEGSALVTYAAQASGCAILVSEAAGARCTHLQDGLIHAPGDVETLTEHLRLIASDRELRLRLRKTGIETAASLTWSAAGQGLIRNYERVLRPGRSPSAA